MQQCQKWDYFSISDHCWLPIIILDSMDENGCAQKKEENMLQIYPVIVNSAPFSHILKCHLQSFPALIHHGNLMSSSRAIHQSLTIALFCSRTHYQRVLAACHKHSVFYSQSGGKGKIYANTKWRIHLSCAI